MTRFCLILLASQSIVGKAVSVALALAAVHIAYPYILLYLSPTGSPVGGLLRDTMGLAENVSALLETYDNCVSLLKAFKKQKKQYGGRRPSKADDKQALLRHSLKADRKKVERAYSSRVSEAGTLFEKGDSKEPFAIFFSIYVHQVTEQSFQRNHDPP